ncbi:putative permease PerM like protein [Maritalea myrionectae]|uniref:Putative permease PerM like protein n=1 Tax=Maritalea myrionectae TaxID=454601 RepID=A0A2R4MCJ3_9HYPH|nr:AI-2E family transporter [Maritalea myrionectae]AVX03655.1 putative permease PerM like protein [Maritalea myrionectae]
MSSRFDKLQVAPWMISLLQLAAYSLVIILALSTMLIWGQVILAPLVSSIVIGLMFGPLADRIERFGVPPVISGGAVVLIFFLIIMTMLTAFILPLSGWISRLPELWYKLQGILADWQGMMSAIEGAREQLDKFTSQSADMVVQVEEGSPIKTVAVSAPTALAQILIFLVSLYFFIATREQIKSFIIGLFATNSSRTTFAVIFDEVEQFISRYLLSITFINIGLGLTISFALWAVGIPAPFLWGMLAGLMNYITYIGPVIMMATLFGVGLVTFDTVNAALIPVIIYTIINGIEAQIITPSILGRAMTLNPFLVFFAITFWIWAWGPLGGFIAVPMLLIMTTVIQNLAAHTGVTENKKPQKPG